MVNPFSGYGKPPVAPLTETVASQTPAPKPLDQNLYGTEGAVPYTGGPEPWAGPTPPTITTGGKVYNVKPGISFDGKTYAVINRNTGQVVGAYKGAGQARAHVDRLDNSYGSYISHRVPLSWLK